MHDTYGAAILAGGKSSRMGSTKALLEFGGQTVLERVSSALRVAGVEDIVVVAGYEPERIRGEAARLGLHCVHNALHETGMFSSIQAGVRALGTRDEAFFVLPVDCPLIRPQALADLMTTFQRSSVQVLFPGCLDRRGHPPLISKELRTDIESAGHTDNLRDVLNRSSARSDCLGLIDLTVLLDMDTPNSYQTLRRIASLMDNPRDGGGELSVADSSQLLEMLPIDARIKAHCREVARVVDALIRALASSGTQLDAELACSAALLHDLARSSRDHARVGGQLLRDIGLARIAQIVNAHMVLPESDANAPHISESQLVYLADKLVVEDRAVGLEARAKRAHEKHGDNPAVSREIDGRMETAKAIADKIASLTGRSVEQLI